jgi:hypothetical protein
MLVQIDDVTKDLVAADLKKRWHFQRETEFRAHLKDMWYRTDEFKIILGDVRHIRRQLEVKSKLKGVCNKFTGFYWMQSAQDGSPNLPEPAYTSGIVYASMFEEWRRCDPNFSIEFGHFIANPVRLTGAGPSTLQEIVNAHASIYAHASNMATTLEDYSIYPSYPSIIMVCDHVGSDIGEKCKTADGDISLLKAVQHLSVLLVLTGAKNSLSVSLKALSKFALPLNRDDVVGLDVIRVSLDVAVQFFVDIKAQTQNVEDVEHKHIDSSLCILGVPKGYDRSVRLDRDNWVRAMQAAAERDGYFGADKSKLEMQSSLLRVHAERNGKELDGAWEYIRFASRWIP